MSDQSLDDQLIFVLKGIADLQACADEIKAQAEANKACLDAQQVTIDANAECLAQIKAELTCPELATCSFRLNAFDFDNGVFDADYVHSVSINGGAPVLSPFDPTWTRKSQAYAPTIAAINAKPGCSATLENDVAITDQGHPSYLIEVQEGSVLELVNNHTGAVFTMTALEGGNCTATFVDDQGNDIGSNVPEIL